ncbi:MAG: hypothetical protein II821_06905 [Treponema sp.]|nr:hypothetical protein [Treponema sp.]
MSKKAVSLVLVFCVSVLFSTSAFSQNSAGVANRRTAVRYLQLSKQFAAEKLWAEADSNAKMGLAYDEKIADLWYLRALSQMNLGEKKSKILPLIVTALTDSEWVDYNRDGARILYADILSSTRLFTQSLAVLDSSPFVYSADAEYLRSRNYYCLGGEENLKKARSRLDAARRVYPADSRFAELFYSYEYQIFRKTGKIQDETQVLANAFSLMVPLYKKSSDDLEIYAAVFSSDSGKKNRMLKAFNSKGKTAPLYALEALKTGLLSEDSALDYFYKFSDQTISLSVLEDFASLIKNDEAKKEFSEYLNSWNGTLTIDTDGDLITNITAVYKRGRPESVSYDENQDDENDWTASCDFGVPVRLTMAENALELEYSAWPYISSAVYKMQEKHADLTLSLIAETLSWSPFSVEVNPSLKNSLNSDFFVPVLSDINKNPVSGDNLLKAALSYEIPSKEREGAVIKVSLLNGTAQIASYSVGEKIYAMAAFEKGIPVSRKLDIDGDGLFETTEYYGFSASGNENFISAGDEMQIMTNLFGSPARGTGFYVKKITVDRNGDTVPDFTEEYLPGEFGDKKPGKIASWDTDGDGNWDVQYIKYPSSDSEKILEEAKFHYPVLNTKNFSEKNNSSEYIDGIITVSSENEIPLFVKCEETVLSVKNGNNSDFYWISIPGTQKDEQKILEKINQTAEQGVSVIVDCGDKKNPKRYLAVRIEKKIFALQIENNE